MVEIVGVVGDVQFTGLDAEGAADVYVPYTQTPTADGRSGSPTSSAWPCGRGASRASSRPSSGGSCARSIRTSRPRRFGRWRTRSTPRSPTGASRPSCSKSSARRRSLLALAGIYAVTAFSVVERTREIGVRLSLGSTRRRILSLIARQSLLPVAAGLAAGGGAALALGRLLSGLLFGVAANDVATLAGAAGALALFAAAACVVPALRATRIDPVKALRAD